MSSQFKEILNEMAELHDKKRADYASGDPFGNFREAERIGLSAFMGTIVRIQDKYSRICNIVREGSHEVVDETLEDTLIDLANYAVIALALLRAEEKKVEAPDDTSHIKNAIALALLRSER